MTTTGPTPDHRPPVITAGRLAAALAEIHPDTPVRIVSSCAHDHHVSLFVRHMGEPGGVSWFAVSDDRL